MNQDRIGVPEVFEKLENRVDTKYSRHEHYDYVRTLADMDGIYAVIVGDLDARKVSREADYPNIPTIHALFVKESYRKQGFGTMLVNNFVSDIQTGRVLVHCKESLKDFYRNTNPKIEFLSEMEVSV